MSDASKDAKKIVGDLGPVAQLKITNQQAFDEFKRLSTSKILNEGKQYTASDGKVWSLGDFSKNFVERIKIYPLEEQRRILVRRKMYLSLNGKRNAAYRKAYGTTLNKDGLSKKDRDQLTPFQQRKEEIIELFGRMFSLKEVHEICLKDWDLRCTIESLSKFKNAHQHVILQKIEEYKRTYDNVRLGYKRSRLEELSWMFEKRKKIYEFSKKGEDHRLMLMTLEQLRKEAEGDTLKIDANLNLNMELTIKNQIENELMKNALIKEIIISRVSAKLGLDPMRMLTSIKDSFYNERLALAEDIPHEEVRYPSSQTYDFQKIEAINKQSEQQLQIAKEKYEAAKVLAPEIKDKAEDLKKSLIERLSGKKQAIQQIKNSAFFNHLNKDEQ